MNKQVFVVELDIGEYEDAHHAPMCAFTEESKAIDFKNRVNAALKELGLGGGSRKDGYFTFDDESYYITRGGAAANHYPIKLKG